MVRGKTLHREPAFMQQIVASLAECNERGGLMTTSQGNRIDMVK
jgi:hypothetical protein